MDAFLRALICGNTPRGLQVLLRKNWGDDVAEVLERERVLVEGDRSRFYICPGGSESCPREVMPNTEEGFPWVAIPGGSFCCEPVRLTDEDVRTWEMSLSAWTKLLAGLFDVKGTISRDEVFPYAVRLGKAVWRGALRDVIYATDPGVGTVPHLFLRQMKGRPALVLLPMRVRWYASEFDELFGPGDSVEVLFLEDVLFVEAGEVVLRCEQEGAPEATNVMPTLNEAYAMMTDAEGTRTIDEAAYRDVISRAEEYDLFLDVVSSVQAGRYRACRRGDDGFHDGSLTHQQAFAYAELMEKGRPMRAAELDALSTHGSSYKQLEAARRELDVKTGRTSWRSTQFIKGDEVSANRYVFRPPDGVWWCLLRSPVGRLS